MKNVQCPFCFQLYTGYGPCPHCGHSVGEFRGGAQQVPLGTILDGKYQLGMVLGQGGFGITYLAYDLTLRMRVAIKEYFPLGLVTRLGQTVTFTGGNAQPFFQKGVEAFYREAQLLARFQTHPNIVHVSSFFRQNGTAYFVMEYVEGESLSAYLDRCGGRLSYDETVRLLTPILDALSDVHNAGILHRDIAPDNICLTKDGNVKLLDFGAAKNELSIHTHSSAAILKPGYAPMEQYTAGSNQGPWTDIYAMGAVIYRCLTGIVPPDAPDRIIGQPLLSFREASVSAPAGAEAAINKALSLDIQNRWQRAADFQNALIDPSALKNIKSQIHKQEKPQKQKPRKPWLIPVLIIIALFLIAGVIISQAILPKERVYREGTLLIAEGKYEDAVQRLSEISSYRDSKQQIRRAKSLQAEEFLALDDYDNAMTLFVELSGAEYALERIDQRKEVYKQLHLETPVPTTQMMMLEITPEPMYDLVLVQNELQKRLSTANSGDIISFGQYEQNGNKEDGYEVIEWIVLDKSENQLFVVSKYGLDWGSHDVSIDNGLDGEQSEDWLNSKFIERAFNDDEKQIIADTKLLSIQNKDEIVTKKVYLLNIEEVEKFFPQQEDRAIKGTPYTDNNSRGYTNWWWLRSFPYKNFETYKTYQYHRNGIDQYSVMATRTWNTCSCIDYYGQINENNIPCTDRGLIRPAIRINLFTEKDVNLTEIQFENISEEKDVNYLSAVQEEDILQFGSYEQDGDKTNGKEPIDWIVLDNDDVLENDQYTNLEDENLKLLPDIQVGNYLSIGHYEQDNDFDNGSESIEWQVLKVENERALLISRYALDVKQYNETWTDVTWEKCTLRQWLNETFFETAFNDSEKAKIQTVNLKNSKNAETGINGGNDTSDKIFILSINEANQYFSSNKDRECKATVYAKSKGSFINGGNDNVWWWLRSPGAKSDSVAGVSTYGAVPSYGPGATWSNAVRPAFWINW